LKQLYLLLLLFATTAHAQQNLLLTGKLINEQNLPIADVNIKVIETAQFASTDEKGEFKLNFANLREINLTLEFSFIGYQKLSKTIALGKTNLDLGNIVLKELNLSLKTIAINAKRNYEGSSNSSLMISRDVIEQTPALSISDLLQQIPNRKITAPSLQNVQNITLRSTFAPTTNGRGAYELNNAFGVAIILDGNTISNNMNMQSFNPGLLGAGNSLLSSSSGYGLNGTSTSTYSGDYTFGGTDLRQIPADHIESIEVIAGVAPAKYGDLSDGAIILERQAGKAPIYLRMQLRDNATSYGYSQGLKLAKHAGAINLGVNYVNSYADNRDKLKAYQRITTSLMHTNSYGKNERLKNTLSFDYGRNLDGIRRDADVIGTLARFDSWNVSVANRSSYRLNNKFLKNISLNLRYAEGHQVSYREQFRNEPYVIISDATTTGIHEGTYVAGVYTSASLIDGRPVNASARLDFTGDVKTGKITHFIGFGGSFDYGANKGLGQVLDPNRPRALTSISATSLNANRSERYYDFNLAIPQENVGLYLEDSFSLNLFKQPLNVRAGMRYDIQNALPSFSPRLNMNYQLSQTIKVGFAYGLAYKSPSLAQRYPGPTYYEIPLINAYNGKAAESMYLVYVNRYDPNASGIRSAKSQTIEFTSEIKIKDFNLSISLFDKKSTDGISTVTNRKYVTVPTYSATFVPNQQPLITQTGSRIVNFQYHVFNNDLTSKNIGFELLLNTPKITAIATQFNISGGLFSSNYATKSASQQSFEDAGTTRPDYAVVGFYAPTNRTSYLSNGHISSATHIPKISLIVSFIADFSIFQKTIQSATAGIPTGYLTRDGRYIGISNFDPSNSDYSHLYKPQSELDENNLARIIPNFHLSLAKDIKKRFRFAFNVYNVFNYQPYYINSTGTYNYPNAAPSFGAELALKL